MLQYIQYIPGVVVLEIVGWTVVGRQPIPEVKNYRIYLFRVTGFSLIKTGFEVASCVGILYIPGVVDELEGWTIVGYEPPPEVKKYN